MPGDRCPTDENFETNGFNFENDNNQNDKTQETLNAVNAELVKVS